jgi:hypothetical protein
LVKTCPYDNINRDSLLFLSIVTLQKHVRNVYNFLGFSCKICAMNILAFISRDGPVNTSGVILYKPSSYKEAFTSGRDSVDKDQHINQFSVLINNSASHIPLQNCVAFVLNLNRQLLNTNSSDLLRIEMSAPE